MDAYNVDNKEYRNCKLCGRIHTYNVLCFRLGDEATYYPVNQTNDEARRSLITKNIIANTKSW